MASLLIRDLDGKVVAKLKKRAQRNGRSLQAEAREILEQAATVDVVSARAMADRIRKQMGRKFDDSTALVREDRDRYDP